MIIKEKIRQLISCGHKTIFQACDFSDIGSKSSIMRALNALLHDGFILRLSKGKYVKTPGKHEKRILSVIYKETGYPNLTVFCEGQTVGTLSGNSDKISFKYDDVWIEKGFPLSFAMPLRKEAFDDEETRAFFGNLIPEEGMYAMLCRAKKISRHDLISFFRYFGKECAGALTISENGAPVVETGELRDITEEIREFLGQDMGGSMQLALNARMSLGGAQDKLPVIYKEGRIFLNDGPCTHIIKPDSREYPYSARNEHFCTELAAALGCETAQTDLIVFPERDVFVTERFDRVSSGKNIFRLHQEDFCQALGLLSDYKYQGQGVFFGFSDMLAVCQENNVPVGDSFAKAQIVNYLIGNHDAHAKNFSILHLPDGPKIAPLYDLVCTEVYPGLDTTMGMLFGKHHEKAEIDEYDFFKAAVDCGIDSDKFVELAEEMADTCRKTVPELVQSHTGKYGGCKIYKKLEEKILASCEKMLELTEKYALLPKDGDHM